MFVRVTIVTIVYDALDLTEQEPLALALHTPSSPSCRELQNLAPPPDMSKLIQLGPH